MTVSEIFALFQYPFSLYITLLNQYVINLPDWHLYIQLSQNTLLLNQLSRLMLQILSKAAPALAVKIVGQWAKLVKWRTGHSSVV